MCIGALAQPLPIWTGFKWVLTHDSLLWHNSRRLNRLKASFSSQVDVLRRLEPLFSCFSYFIWFSVFAPGVWKHIPKWQSHKDSCNILISSWLFKVGLLVHPVGLLRHTLSLITRPLIFLTIFRSSFTSALILAFP